MGSRELGQPVAATTEEFEQTHVAENLKLLPNLWPHMTVQHMECPKPCFMGVNLLKTEFRLAKGFENEQDVQSPPAHFGLDLLERPEAVKLMSNSSGRNWDSIQDNRYACALGNGTEHNVAAHPVVALRRAR